MVSTHVKLPYLMNLKGKEVKILYDRFFYFSNSTYSHNICNILIIVNFSRIQGNMQRVKAIEDKAKRVGVDSAAAKRVVKHELHQFKAKKQKNEK